MIISSDPAFWENQLKRPLLDRLGVATDELLTHVTATNLATKQDGNPEKILPPPDFLADVKAAIAEIPPIVLKLLDKPLLGVYFARGLGSSAISDVVVGDSGRVLGSVTLLDADIFLYRTANEWANWKENSPFVPNTHYKIDVVIERPENDNRKNALQFLLLHEFAHVLTAKSEFLPDWWVGAQKFKSSEEYSYLSLSWQIAMSNEIIPLLREDFTHRKMLSYYSNVNSEKRLSGDLIPEIYQGLDKTSFPTLYASTNAYDDFAESFATYVHRVLMNRPLEIAIKLNDRTISKSSDFWSSQRARAKLNFFVEYLGQA